MIKSILKNTIKNNSIMSKLFLKFSNKLKGSGNIVLPGMNVRNNCIKLDETNSLICGENCNIQNNIANVSGTDNQIIIGNNVQMYGNDRNATFLIWGEDNKIEIADNCRMTNVQFFIRGDHNIIRIHKDCSAVYTCFHIESDVFIRQNIIEIFDGTTIHGRNEKQVEIFLDEGTNVKIGKDCMLSNNVLIRTTDSHSITDLSGNRLNLAKDVIIGNHCWIGANVTILKGVTIADRNVISACSVCTKSFDGNNTILAGIPAKPVKYDIDWCRKQL